MNPIKFVARSVMPAEWKLSSELPFAFEIEGKPVQWRMTMSVANPEGGEHLYVSTNGKLKLRVSTKVVHPHEAVVVKSTLVNSDDKPTEPFSLVEPARFNWAIGDGGTLQVRTLTGGFDDRYYPPQALRLETVRLDPRGWRWLENGADGRSSNKNMPFFLVSSGVSGYAAALEWSGLWFGGISAELDGTTSTVFTIPVKKMVLQPKEEIPLPAVHLVFSETGGMTGVTNALRRYLNEIVMPWLSRHEVAPPISYNSWFGIQVNMDEKLMMAQADAAAKAGAEYFVLDAGWYAGTDDGNFDSGIGNWERVDTKKFPNGLKPLADHIASLGMGMGLWFELERAHPESDWAKQHPEWFINIGKPFLHLNLALPEVQDACINLLKAYIEQLGLKWVKLDYNFGPKPFWNHADPTFKIQFAYLAGLYRVLDELIAAHPEVVFECCAGGGRRIDMAMLRRCHVAWLSDEAFSSENVRFIQSGANYLFTGHMNATGLPFGETEGNKTVSEYDVACRMLGPIQLHGNLAMLSDADLAKIRSMTDMYRTFRHLLDGYFFPLTPQPTRDNESEVVQFVFYKDGERDSGKDSVILAFGGRDTAASNTMHIKPQGLDDATTYDITPLHHKRRMSPRTGAHLKRCGLKFNLPARSWAAWRITKRTCGNKK